MKGLYIIHRGRDLGVFEFECNCDCYGEFEELADFHFEERLDPTQEFALFYKKDYFEKESEMVWDKVDFVVTN